MSILKLKRILMGRSLFLSTLFCGLSSQPAWAVNIPITAEFMPNPSSPRFNQFVNTTPYSGFCTDGRAACKTNGIFSVEANINFGAKPIRKGETAYIKAPWEWRKVTVTHPIAGPQEVEVRITGVGSKYFVFP